jgi:hypothetical protein
VYVSFVFPTLTRASHTQAFGTTPEDSASSEELVDYLSLSAQKIVVGTKMGCFFTSDRNSAKHYSAKPPSSWYSYVHAANLTSAVIPGLKKFSVTAFAMDKLSGHIFRSTMAAVDFDVSVFLGQVRAR